MKLVVASALLIHSAFASCPNACSGHGTCNIDDQCTCFKEDAANTVFLLDDDGCSGFKTESTCNAGKTSGGAACGWGTLSGDTVPKCLVEKGATEFEASSRYGTTAHDEWTGADCSRRTCPRGTSWTTLSAADKDGNICSHLAEVECSDQGLCDRATGQCNCFPGFVGSACQRTSCPDNCSGHGTCRSNKDFAYDFGVSKTYQLLQNVDSTERFSENYLVTYDQAWDSGMLYGCLCDVGYRGPACSLVECPSGTDPLDDKCSEASLQKIPDAKGDPEHPLYVENFQIQRFAATGAKGWQEAYTNSISHEQGTEDKCDTLTKAGGFNKAQCEAVVATAKSPNAPEAFCVFVAGVAADPSANQCADKDDGSACTHTTANTCTKVDTSACTHLDATKDKATCEATPGCLFTAGKPAATDKSACESVTDCVFAAAGSTTAGVADVCKQPTPAIVTDTGEIMVGDTDKNNHFYQGVVYSCFGAMAGQDCSGRGTCDYSTGQCQCFSGYSGTACNHINEMI